jgi:hypothetical protein
MLAESKNTGFIMVDSQDGLQSSIKTTISQIVGLPLSRIDDQEIKSIRAMYDDRDFRKYPSLLRKYFLSGNQLLLKQRLCIQSERFFDLISSMSYGLNAPSYFKELSAYKKESPQTNKFKSLFIGCSSIDSAVEFLAVNHSVFNDSENLIIDLNTDQLEKIPEAVEMDGTKTSFSNNYFDTLQTNFLLYQLQSPSYSKEESILKFFIESFRITKPGGKLIMVEGLLVEGDRKQTDLLISNLLTETGFKNISIDYAEEFIKSSDVSRLTRSSHGNLALLESVQSQQDNRILLITARK